MSQWLRETSPSLGFCLSRSVKNSWLSRRLPQPAFRTSAAAGRRHSSGRSSEPSAGNRLIPSRNRPVSSLRLGRSVSGAGSPPTRDWDLGKPTGGSLVCLSLHGPGRRRRQRRRPVAEMVLEGGGETRPGTPAFVPPNHRRRHRHRRASIGPPSPQRRTATAKPPVPAGAAFYS